MNKKLPLIGITPLWDKVTNSTAMRSSYIGALEYAGAIPVIIPLTENHTVLDYYLDMCDGILLSGGQDVQPELYGETPQPHCGEVAPCRDKLDRYIFESALAQDKPILGICRGCQAMNVFAGGSLYQDLKIDFGTGENHRMSEPFNRMAHLMIPQILGGEPMIELADNFWNFVPAHPELKTVTIPETIEIFGDVSLLEKSVVIICPEGSPAAIFFAQAGYTVQFQ